VAWVFKFDIFKLCVCVCVYLPVYCIIFVSFNHVKHCKKEIKRMEKSTDNFLQELYLLLYSKTQSNVQCNSKYVLKTSQKINGNSFILTQYIGPYFIVYTKKKNHRNYAQLDI